MTTMDQAYSFLFVLLIMIGSGLIGWCLRDYLASREGEHSGDDAH